MVSSPARWARAPEAGWALEHTVLFFWPPQRIIAPNPSIYAFEVC
jgi:hypothetical protein